MLLRSTQRTFLRVVLCAASLFPCAQTSAAQGISSGAVSAAHPETVEWVYRVRYGFHDEWFQIFRKYQLAILDRQKQLGYVLNYTVWAPSLHTSEDSRWDYRIVITRAAHDAPPGQSESDVARELFPDQASFQRDENRRWELTANHWDLPIHQVDLNKAE